MAEIKTDFSGVSEQVSQAVSSMEAMNKETSSFSNTLKEVVDTAKVLDTLVSTLKPINVLDDKTVANLERTQKLLGTMATAMGVVQKQNKGGLDSVRAQLVLQNQLVNKIKERHKLEQSLTKETGKRDVTEKQAERRSKMLDTSLKSNISKVKSYGNAVASTFGGFSLSLGGILMYMLQINNETRRLTGLSMQTAGQFRKSEDSLGRISGSISDIKTTFGMTYEEAHAVVDQVVKMGFSLKNMNVSVFDPDKIKKITPQGTAKSNQKVMELMGKAKALQSPTEMPATTATYKGNKLTFREAYKQEPSSSDLSTARNLTLQAKMLVDAQIEINDAARESENLEKQKAAHYASQRNIAKELLAYQKAGIYSIQSAGTAVLQLERNFGKSTEEAGSLLGAFSQMGDELRSSGVNISTEEMLQDWQSMTQKVRIFRTDVLGLAGLYKLMATNAEKIGLGGMGLDVRRDMMQTMMGMPVNLNLGWKAKLGQGMGATPAQSALRFEKMMASGPAGQLEGLAKIADMIKDVSSRSDPAVAEIQARLLLEQLGFTKEVSIKLGELISSGEVNSDKVRGEMSALLEESSKLATLDKQWPAEREKLITYAATASTMTVNIEELTKRMLRDYLRPMVSSLANLVGMVRAAGSHFGFFKGTSTKETLQEQFAGATTLGQGGRGVAASELARASEFLVGKSESASNLHATLLEKFKQEKAPDMSISDFQKYHPEWSRTAGTLAYMSTMSAIMNRMPQKEASEFMNLLQKSSSASSNKKLLDILRRNKANDMLVTPESIENYTGAIFSGQWWGR